MTDPFYGNPPAGDWTGPPAPPPVPMVPVAPARIDGLRTAGTAAMVLLAVVAAISVADLGLTPSAVQDPAGAVAAIELVVLLVQVLAILGTAAAFMTWLFIAMKNLQGWRIRLKWGPGWAIGAWFIPFANLIIPVMVVNEAAQGSASTPDVRLAPQRASTGLIGAWWATLLLGSCVTNLASRQTFATDQGAYAMGYQTPGTLLYVTAAVLGILVIRHITGLQERRHAAMAAMWQQRPY